MQQELATADDDHCISTCFVHSAWQGKELAVMKRIKLWIFAVCMGLAVLLITYHGVIHSRSHVHCPVSCGACVCSPSACCSTGTAPVQSVWCHAVQQACSSQTHQLFLQQPHIFHCIGQAMGRTTALPPAAPLLHNMVGFTRTIASKLPVTRCRVPLYIWVMPDKFYP